MHLSLPTPVKQQSTKTYANSWRQLTSSMSEQDHPRVGGNPPTIFDGDPSKAQEFMGDFRCYCMLNPNHPNLIIPFQRMITCLTFMKGPEVTKWVAEETDYMEERQARGANPYNPAAWDTFKVAFEEAFLPRSNSQDEALCQLIALRMQQEKDPGHYIDTFNELAKQCGWKWEAIETVCHFKKGLSKILHHVILKFVHPRPITLDKWQGAALNQYLWHIIGQMKATPMGGRQTLASRMGIHPYKSQEALGQISLQGEDSPLTCYHTPEDGGIKSPPSLTLQRHERLSCKRQKLRTSQKAMDPFTSVNLGVYTSQSHSQVEGDSRTRRPWLTVELQKTSSIIKLPSSYALGRRSYFTPAKSST
jgi:hypothetical protein